MDTGKKVMLKVCPIVVSNSDGLEIQTYALLDEGSTVTLIEEDLADQLNLAGHAQALYIHGVNSTQRERTSRVVRLKLRGLNSKASYIIRTRTIRDIQLLNQTIPTQLLQYPHLLNLDPNSVCYEHARPRILIGSDNWELIVSRQLLTGRRHEPAASRTELGWVIHGSAPLATLSCGQEHVLHIGAENTNSQRVLTTIAKELRTQTPIHLGIDHHCQEKTLGLPSLPAEEPVVSINRIPGQLDNKNRAPQRIGWDEPEPTEVTEDFKLKNLEVKPLRLTRYYNTGGARSLVLNVLNDDGAKAYAGYWRVLRYNGMVDILFTAVNAKVAPLRVMTLQWHNIEIRRCTLYVSPCLRMIAELIPENHKDPDRS